MKTSIFVWIGVFASISAPIFGHEAFLDWSLQVRERFVTEVLPNGLTVLCYPMPGTFKVHVGITYDVGSKHEQPHEFGFAHMVEHMMFKGTDKISETGLKDIAQKYHMGDLGEGYNAMTTPDNTLYYFQGDKSNWPLFVTILADWMFNLRFDEDHVASEAKAIIEEINLRSAKISGLIGSMYGSLMFPYGHPYHHPVIGYKDIVLGATSKDLKKFYQKHYHPKKALLTIIGDITVSEALGYARKAFETEAVTPACNDEVVVRPTSEVSSKKVTVYKTIPHAQYFYFWKISHDSHETAYASLLGRVLTRRLEKLLVEDKDLVYAVQSSVLKQHLCGVLYYTFEPKHEMRLQEVKDLIKSEITRLMNEGPTDSELTCYQKRYEVDFVKQFESAAHIASLVAHEFFPTRSYDAIFTPVEVNKTLTKEGLKIFMRRNLRPVSCYTLICLPMPKDEEHDWLEKKQNEDAYEQRVLEGRIRHQGLDPIKFDHEFPEHVVAHYASERPDKVITLKNGLEVYLKKRSTTPFMHGILMFKHAEAFSIQMSLQEKSMAYLFAMDMLAFGTSKYSKEQNQEFFDLKGATVGISTAGAHISCLPQDFIEVGARSLEILKNPAYSQKILSQEIQSLLDQFGKLQKVPGYMADRLLKLQLFKSYPWVRSDDALCNELKKLSRSDIVSFHKKYINPQNMFLVIVGDVDFDGIERDLENTFGKWQPDKAFEKIRAHVPQIECGSEHGTLLTHSMSSEQIYLGLGRITHYYESTDMLVLRLIESYLFNKIFEIREQTGAFYSFKFGFNDAMNYQKGLAEILIPLSSHNAESVEKMVRDTLGRIVQEGIPQEFIDTAKFNMRVQLLKSCSTNAALAQQLAGIIAHDEPIDIFEQRLTRLQNLTKEEVDAIVRVYLDPECWTVVKVGRLHTEDTAVPPLIVKESGKTSHGFLKWLLSWL